MALRYFEFTPVVKVDVLNGLKVFWERVEGVAILTQLTPSSADHLHYSRELPGGGLDIDEA